VVEPGHPSLSVRQQCKLLGLSRASYYYQPAQASELNLELMKLIDEQYLKTPFYGYRKMTVCLQGLTYMVNRKRVRRLMNLMGIQAVGPKPQTSRSGKAHKIYPYLLRGVKITHANQVWSADITYVPMQRGFMYLVAILDWHSRYVLSWEISNTLDGAFCLEALESALAKYDQPKIFNTDQGVQFTADAFTQRLKNAEIEISMDGRGRFVDNIFIERLWRSVKYENIYLNDYQTGIELAAGLADYFDLYNHERPHQSLDYQTPAQVYGIEQPITVQLSTL
jgi:putative transposase